MGCDPANSNVIFTVIRIYRHAIYKYPNQKGRGGWSCQVKVGLSRRAEDSALTCSLQMVADFTGSGGVNKFTVMGILFYITNRISFVILVKV